MYVKAFSPSILGKNHVAYMDNYYFTSVPLFEDLEQNMKIYSCGTLPPNRLTKATETVDKKSLKTMNRGDYSLQSKNINIVATVWKDKKHRVILYWCNGDLLTSLSWELGRNEEDSSARPPENRKKNESS